MTHVSLKVIPVPGDGDCLYHAIIKGIDISVTPKDLRNFVAEQILMNNDLYEDLVLELIDFGRVKDSSRMTPAKLANVIKHTKEWATSTVIHILANAFNIKILVIQKINNRFYSEEFPSPWKYDMSLDNKQSKKVVYVYRRGYHFELLEPIGYINATFPDIRTCQNKTKRNKCESNRRNCVDQWGGAYRQRSSMIQSDAVNRHQLFPGVVGMILIMISIFTF